MEYVYAALILNETDAEINEANLTDVLDAAGVDVEESRVKALVAALEDVDIDEAVEEAAAVPATTSQQSSEPDDDGGDAAEEEEAADEPEDDDDDDAGDAGEGLGELFG